MLQPSDLLMEQLHQSESASSVFKPQDGDGFTEEWWEYTGSHNVRRFRFIFRGEEVARADVVADAIVGDEYVGPHSGKPAPKIWFIEVRDTLQRSDMRVGHAAVQALVELHAGRMCAVSVPEARGFWASIGWIEYPDREIGAANSSFFVSP